MTTATRSISERLGKLEARAAEAHAKAREAREARNRWESEVPDLQAQLSALDPDSPEVKKLAAGITEREASRLHGIGERADAYVTARDMFHVIDQELEDFKREHIRERIAELNPERVVAELADHFAAVVAAVDRYQALIVEVRNIVLDTPGFDGQDVRYDGRVDDMARIAEDALRGEIAVPGLTPNGEWKADNHG